MSCDDDFVDDDVEREKDPRVAVVWVARGLWFVWLCGSEPVSFFAAAGLAWVGGNNMPAGCYDDLSSHICTYCF